MMSNQDKGGLYLHEEQREEILKSPESQMDRDRIVSKTLAEQLVDKLDKVLAIVLVFILILYFIQSSGVDSNKKVLTRDALIATQPPSIHLDPTSSTKPKIDEQQQDQLSKKHKKDSKKVGRDALKALLQQNENNEQQKQEIDTLQNYNKKKIKKNKQLKKTKNEHISNDNIQSIFEQKLQPTPKPQPKPKIQQSSTDSQEELKSTPESRLQQLKYIPHRRRSEFFKSKDRVQHLEYLKLAKFNLITPDIDEDERQLLLEQERTRLQQKYKMSEFPQELSLCVVAHASSHKKAYAHQYLLNSILSQEYEHYIVVYVADGFTAEQVQPVKQFLKLRDGQRRVKLVWNNEKKYFLESTITAVKAFCMEKRVTVLIDGDDQLLGTQVFRLLNTLYRRYSANLIYGNFIQFHEVQQQLRVGFSTQYQDSQKRDNTYRSIGQKFGSIKTFKTRLISFIKDSDLRDSFGVYFHYAGDYALMYPLLELACGQVRYMPQYNYLYFGYQIDPTYGSMQIANGRAIRDRARYDCFKKYK